MAGRPYAGEEILSFERIKRAVTKRVLDTAEPALEEGTPLDKDKLAELTVQEWKAVKAAVRLSPAAREKAREYMQTKISEIIDDLIRSDRGELESLGVQEKYM